MKGKDILRDLSLAGRPTLPKAAASDPDLRKASGAVRAMSLGLDRLTDEAAKARDLQHAIEHGEHVVDLDPALIDSSIITDRIPTETDQAFEELKASIAKSGQQVPVLVRQHPDGQGRYQAAYGHRRIKASRELGRTVRAIVKPLTDTELITAQAQENGPRLDLSFVERALFAGRLNIHGFDRDTICTALGVDKPEASRLLGVAEKIDAQIILAIGPAPKVGRPRWLALAEVMEKAAARERATATIATERFKRADSNVRFQIVFDAAASKVGVPSPKRVLSTGSGDPLGWVIATRRSFRLSADQPEFAAFLERRMPELIAEFDAASGAAQPSAQSKEGG